LSGANPNFFADAYFVEKPEKSPLGDLGVFIPTKVMKKTERQTNNKSHPLSFAY